MPVAAIVVIAFAAFLALSWLLGRRSGRYVAPGLGPVGGGTGLIAVGGALVVKGNVVAGALVDLIGVILIWAAFRTVGGG